jgi:hypothetical protein
MTEQNAWLLAKLDWQITKKMPDPEQNLSGK